MSRDTKQQGARNKEYPHDTWYTSKSFIKRREEVIKFVRDRMHEQGATEVESLVATNCINFFSIMDVDNLYKCINSELTENVIASIVAHDFNGLSREDKFFLPKSSQFKDKELHALSS